MAEWARRPLRELMEAALEAKLRHRGDRLGCCAILNVRSGACGEDCAFCAQSARYRTGAPVYPFKDLDEILRAAERARAAGAERFSLVASGRGASPREVDLAAVAVRAIRERVGIQACASLGILDGPALAALRDAGLSRYHHNLETSEGFFPRIVTTHTYAERVATVRAARRAGLEVCAGGVFGLGETLEDRMDLAVELAGLQVDSVPLNFLVPIAGTPLEGRPPLSVVEVLRTVALFRLALPDRPIRICGGREQVLGGLQGLAYWAGADALMVGGYLTVGGAAVEDDRRFVAEMRALWREEIGRMRGAGPVSG
nr:biotin synthase BioB [Dissulfurirhabdus thermomarina]